MRSVHPGGSGIRGMSIFIGILLGPVIVLELERNGVRIWSRFAEGKDVDLVLCWLVLVRIFLSKP